MVTIANQVIAANIDIEITPSRSRVVAAFLDFGFLKAGTPFAMASIPVSAVVPDEKARASRKISSAPLAVVSGSISQVALSACGIVPSEICQIPQATIAKIPTMNP